MRIVIKNVRLAFGQGLFERREGEDGKKGKFGCKGLIAPNHPQIKELEAAMTKVASEKWGPKAPAILKAIKLEGKTVLHDGDAKPEWDGFAGMQYINASSDVKPTVKNQSGANAEDGEVYSGCYGNLHLELWAQDNKFGKRINAQCRGFQKVKDGDAFSGGGTAASDEEFESIADPDAVDNDL